MPSGDGATLRDYHERTKHSVARIRANSHYLDFAIKPRPFKVYADLEPTPLPRDFTTSAWPALQALEGRPPDVSTVVDRSTLAQLLYFSAGVLKVKRYAGGEELYLRAAACTGALYHIDLYVVCAALPDLPAGVYHFGPHDFALRRLRDGDHRAVLDAATAGDPAVHDAPASLVYATTFWRNAWKYRARAYRHAYWDAGTILANLLAVAAPAGIETKVVLGFVDAAVNELLGLDAGREASLGIVALGAGAAPPPPVATPGRLDLETLPLSSEEVDYPLIRAAHEGSSLGSAEDVSRWRAAPQPSVSSEPPGLSLRALPPDAVAEPIEAVVLRRGSSRSFPRRTIELAQLATILRAATRPIRTDAPVAPDLYLIANAVEGLAPGSYAVAPGGAGLTLLETGERRREAGHLGLGQALPADAAADLYWLIDLDAVFASLGDRGYRAAQLAAAIAAGRTYLAAYALGLGATGLTFYDDDVTRFFSPHAAGKSVLFLMAYGRRGR